MQKFNDRRECTINGQTIEIPLDLADQRAAQEVEQYLNQNPNCVGWGQSFQLPYNNKFYHFGKSEKVSSHLELQAGHKA